MSPAPVTKAVITAAGHGTRFLPATKATPKEMLPVVDKPALQYVVEEAVRAGIDDLLIITGRGKQSIEDHFDRRPELESFLEEKGKQQDLEEVVDVAELADIHYVRQGEALGLGHAVSVARKHVGDQPFVVLLGDEFIDARHDLLPGMMAAYAEHGGSVIALKEVPEAEISRYGCAHPEPMAGNLVRILDIVEKPKPVDAPSNLAVIGRYVFTPQIFDALARVRPGVGGEIQLTDAIALLLGEQPVFGYTFEQGRYDTGTVIDYLKTTIEVALERPDLGPELDHFLDEVVQRRRR